MTCTLFSSSIEKLFNRKNEEDNTFYVKIRRCRLAQFKGANG